MSLPKVLQKIINNVGYGQALTGNDNDIVHKSGNEVIHGVKSFFGVHNDQMDYQDNISINHDFFVKGVVPESDIYCGLFFCDKNGSRFPDNTIGLVESCISTTGDTFTYLRVGKNDPNARTFYTLGIQYDNTNDVVFGYCPNPPADDNAAHIATTNWTRNLCNNYILTNTKTSLTKGTNPSQKTFHVSWKRYDSQGTENANRLSEIRSFVDANGSVGHEMLAYDFTSGSTDLVLLGIYKPKGGAGYATAPTPAYDDNSTKIATTNWVRSYINRESFSIQRSTCNKGTNPSSNLYWSIYACDKNGIEWVNSLGIWEVTLSTSGTTGSYLRAMKNVANNTDSSTLGVWFTKDGVATVGCSTIEPYSGATCGTSSRKWSSVWATNGTIQTSDERVKTAIDSIPDSILDAWEDVQWKQFKMKESVEAKGENARLHTGIIAQQIQRVFADKNIDPAKYGFFCWDKWNDSEEIRDSGGNIVKEGVKAGEQYSIRYDEALCIEAAYNRRRVSRLEEKIKLLEQKLNLAS